MMASEMTNEELAKHIECGDAILREAAARLRRPTPVDDDLLKMAKDLDAKNAEVAELERKYADACKCADDAERRLKVAEDCIARIAKIDTRPILPYTSLSIIRHRAKEALAAIRGEGGNDAR